MKKIGIIAVVLVLLAITLIGPSAASGSTPALLCRVDIGDVSSEAGHNVVGWGPLEPDTHPWLDFGAPWSGLGDGKARVIWAYGGDLRDATLTLDRHLAGGTARFIRFRHLDGMYLNGRSYGERWANDSFTVSVKNHGDPDSAYQQVYVYTAIGRATSTSQWLVHEINLPSTLNLDRFIDVKFYATGAKWEYFGSDLGQVAFDWIELWGDVPEEEGGNEGFTPGYWKNHTSNWPSPYTTGTKFNTVFGVANSVSPDLTLLQALKTGGGKEKALLRHATAALLNAAHPGVDYPLASVSSVVAFVQAAYASGDFNGAADTLDGYNNLGGSISP